MNNMASPISYTHQNVEVKYGQALELTFSTLEMQGVEEQVECHGDKE